MISIGQMKHLARAATAVTMASLVLLTACGGGGDGPSIANGVRSQPPHPDARPLPALSGVTATYLGLGPAFPDQRPNVGDLREAPEAKRLTIDVRSGSWRNPQGHDGSSNAAEVVEFIKAFQTQSYREGGPNADLYLVEFGRKTLRVHGATGTERSLVRSAVSEINTALPWKRRILLGRDLSRPTAQTPQVPDDEIHLHFTTGKTSWPEDYNQPENGHFVVLGIGGSNRVPDSLTVLGGYAFIDRRAVGPNTERKRFTIIHELLHAYGLGAHVDPEMYPNSYMVPTVKNFGAVRPVFLSMDGEVLLAATRITPGTRVNDLTPNDLGNWTDTAFHLLGHADLDDTGGDTVQFGAGLRNGLAKPWAYGPAPRTRIRNNPSLSGSATWSGGLLGFSGNGRTVAGNAEIQIDLGSLDGSADFRQLESWNREAHPGQPGSGTVWGDGDLGYSIAVTSDRDRQGFGSTFAPGDDPGVVTGTFVGAEHEGTVGVLEHPDLSAAFGAVR